MPDFKATVLIPTYNRSHYLLRLLRYISDRFDRQEIRFTILDGSDREALTNQRLCCEQGFEYRYYDPDTALMDRWLDGLKGVGSEFVSFLADDDILQPDGYHACLDFLSSHPEYAAAHGNYAWLAEEDGHIELYPGYQSFSIENDSPLERLFIFLADYVPITYGVYRTKILQTAYEATVSGIDKDNLHFTELLSGCIPVVLGKVKKVNCDYYWRSLATPAPQPKTVYPQLLFARDFSKRYSSIKTTLKKLLGPSINAEIIDDAIDFCFAAYYGRVLDRKIVTQYFTGLLAKQYPAEKK